MVTDMWKLNGAQGSDLPWCLMACHLTCPHLDNGMVPPTFRVLRGMN